eukprot:TRINITY_DN13674_c0_g1_i6.p1 TRINITY_DN13674_c0_g1~~TRINITY_DN13674_c0_g1_i6.p1  ORF type:complete len:475 (+),score=55.52 TRINITY_DN13674_c0_g1_i6:190-1425(+)
MVIWDSPFIEDDVDAFSSAYTVNGGEETLASSSASTFDEASTHVLSIKPPVFAKPASRRPWVGVSCSLKQAADVAGSQSHATAARLSDEQDTAISPPSTADASSAHDIDVEDCVEAKPHQHVRQAWALDGSARTPAPPETWSARVSKEQGTLGPEASLGRTGMRLESAEEKLKTNFSQYSGVPGRPCSAAKPRAESNHRQRRVNASRFVSDPGRTVFARDEAIQNCDVQRRLHSNGFLSHPCRPHMVGAGTIQRASANDPQLEQAGSSKRSESTMRAKMNSVRPKLEPSSPHVVVMSREDTKGSAVKYNCVRFIATPSLSTACDKNHILTPRAPKAKSATIDKTATHGGPLDAQSATDGILNMFRGWSKREVKEMLKGTYSSEEVAEVLEIISKKERTRPKRSYSKKASGA